MASTDTSRILTGPVVVALFAIISAVQRSGPVTRVDDDGRLIHGLARRIGNTEGVSVKGADIRDLTLWVTTADGFEVFWPIADLVREYAEGTFVIDRVPS